ncbi:MAG: phosphate propanoyltransferase [Candidatus Odinarchaeota archaeon]
MANDQLTDLVRRLVLLELSSARPDQVIPVGLTAKHVHISQEDFYRLFGPGATLNVFHQLSQSGEFSATETVDLVGPKRALYGVRILGPFRSETQVEVSRSDGYVLGLNPPVRQSGDLVGTPGIHLIGLRGAIKLEKGVITPGRHIHMNPEEARRLGVKDKQVVAVGFPGKRAGVLDEVMVHVKPGYNLEMHVDLDEGNALGLKTGDSGFLLKNFDHRSYSPFR